MRIALHNCEIAGLPKTETKEGAGYRFNRQGIERCFPDRDSSYYAELGLSLEAAISLLEGKQKTSTGKIALSADEAETLRRVLHEYKTAHAKYTEGACNAYGLLAVIDEAGKLYREGKRSPAAMKMGWTNGKRQAALLHADIFANYMLLTHLPEPWRKSKMAAVEILQKRFVTYTSKETIKDSLKHTFRILKQSNPDLAGILPNDWPPVEKRIKQRYSEGGKPPKHSL